MQASTGGSPVVSTVPGSLVNDELTVEGSVASLVSPLVAGVVGFALELPPTLEPPPVLAPAPVLVSASLVLVGRDGDGVAHVARLLEPHRDMPCWTAIGRTTDGPPALLEDENGTLQVVVRDGRGRPWLVRLDRSARVPDAPVRLRSHRPGDIGWVISRQAQLYADEYDWDISFEGLLAEICAAFLRDFQPGKEFCWIAERAGTRLGAVFLVSQDDEIAKLRMLHVEQAARGQGVGSLLVNTCIDQARACGYRKLVLWTNDILTSARKIYQAAGFELVEEEHHHSFGKDLVGQNWELVL